MILWFKNNRKILIMASSRNIGLDYLRGLAILIVLFNHGLIGFFFSTSRLKMEGAIVSVSAASVISIEWLFVLSGFLIGTMMIRSFDGDRGWFQCAKDFWLRRWFRTLPNYYLFVFLNVLLSAYGISEGTFEFSHLIFSQNLVLPEKTPVFFGEAWSLALDEWFYVLMPLLIGCLFFLSISRKISFLVVSCILIILPTIGRFLHDAPADFFQWDAHIRRITIYHLDATGWGVFAASMNKWGVDWWRRNTVRKAFAGLILMAAGLFFVVGLLHPEWMNETAYRFGNSFSITLMAGGTFLLLPWLTSLKAAWKSTDWFIGKLSAFSYSIYLVHFPLIFILKFFLEINRGSSGAYVLMVVALWLVLVFIFSAGLFHFFEKPVADMRESFTRRVDASPF